MPEVIYKRYPSGFLGSGTVATTRELTEEELRSRLFNLSAITSPEEHTANLEGTRVWDDVTFGDPKYRTFDFRERILRVAVSAFGTDNLYDWIKVQRESQEYSEYHAKWIDETLGYVLGNKSRRYTYGNWVTLLRAGNGGGSKLDSAVVKYFFRGEGFPGEHYSVSQRVDGRTSILDFIGLWVQVPGGIDDLISSLYVLFGER